MECTLILSGIDFSQKLSTYQVGKEVTYGRVVTTLDNVEHASSGISRPILTFSFRPLSCQEVSNLYEVLKKFQFDVSYSDPYSNSEKIHTMRLVSDLEEVFLLKSIDGNKYYKGGKIQLRGV